MIAETILLLLLCYIVLILCVQLPKRFQEWYLSRFIYNLPGKFECVMCGKDTIIPEIILNHEQQIQFQCTHCGFRFDQFGREVKLAHNVSVK